MLGVKRCWENSSNRTGVIIEVFCWYVTCLARAYAELLAKDHGCLRVFATSFQSSISMQLHVFRPTAARPDTHFAATICFFRTLYATACAVCPLLRERNNLPSTAVQHAGSQGRLREILNSIITPVVWTGYFSFNTLWPCRTALHLQHLGRPAWNQTVKSSSIYGLTELK